jgi:hypothetical protein
MYMVVYRWSDEIRWRPHAAFTSYAWALQNAKHTREEYRNAVDCEVFPAFRWWDA